MNLPRRTFLADLGMGFTGLALGAMLGDDNGVRAAEAPRWSAPDGRPHHPPQARSVIWIFLSGGYSQLETFDPKPALNRYAGMTFRETPYPDPLASPLHDKRSRAVIEKVREKYSRIFPLQVGYRRRGELGIEVTDWWPHLATCVDDIALVRSMHCEQFNHLPGQLMMLSGSALQGWPTLGSWLNYGLGIWRLASK